MVHTGLRSVSRRGVLTVVLADVYLPKGGLRQQPAVVLMERQVMPIWGW